MIKWKQADERTARKTKRDLVQLFNEFIDKEVYGDYDYYLMRALKSRIKKAINSIKIKVYENRIP